MAVPAYCRESYRIGFKTGILVGTVVSIVTMLGIVILTRIFGWW